MWWPEVIIVGIVVIPAIICLGLMVHLLMVQKRGLKLKAWITRELNELNEKVWKRLLQNHALNANYDVHYQAPESVIPMLLEFYDRKDMVFYFDQLKEFGTDEDILRGMEYLLRETTAYYQQHEKVISVAEMAKRYFRDKAKRPLNDV